MAADNNINLAAKNVTLDSAVQYDREQDEKQVKNSGLLASGWGIMIGTEKIKDKASDKYLTQQGSAIGANGKVTIVAAEKAQITSSDISTQQGVEITAPEVSINGKENITESTRIHEEKKSGLTISLGGSSIAAIQSVTQPVKRATDVKDKRLQALYAWRAGRSAKDNKEAFRNMGKGKFDIGINVGFGSSQSKSQTDTVERVYAGSKVIAGETVDIKATEKDLAITGSDVTGKNINLAAKGNIELRAGTNSSHTEVTEKSRDTSISAGYTFGTGFTTGSFSHNQSNMKGQGDTVTHKATHIAANNWLTTKSGADTNIIGATASGNKVDMTIGENLHIETLQDTDNYHETSHSGGISIGVGKGTKPSFGVNGSRGKIDSTYASTTEQAGIYVGTEGFNIRTENNTHLKGAVIASEAAADKNKLSTGNLNWENIENKAEYDAKDVGLAYHKYGDFAKKPKKDKDELYKTKGLAPDFGMPAHGKAKNTTKAAVAQGTLGIREKVQDVRGLSRDTQSALSQLDKIFDKSTIQERQELAKVFGEEAYRLAHKMKGDGSPKKIAVHAIIGGIMSRITGAGFASGSIGAGVNEAVIEEIAKIKDPGTAQVVSSIVGAAAAKIAGGNAVAGGNTAASGTRNNQYGERPRYNGAIIHTKYGFFKVIDGSDVYMEEVPDGIYFWNQDEENSQYGWDFHRKDGVDYYYPNKIEWSIYKNVDGVAYGVVLVRESDYERKLILQKAGKMFIESMIYGSGNEVARDLMEEINNGSINAWNAAKTIFSKYQDIFVEFFKK